MISRTSSCLVVAEVLTALSASVVEDEYKDAFSKVCESTLSLFVSVENRDDSICQVREGSGRGLTCSQEIANVAFDRLVESSPKEKAMVFLYCRYMDDGLILAGGPRSTLIPFFATLRDVAERGV